MNDYEYLVTFAVMLVVAVVIGSLTVRIRAQAAHAVEREARTQALYRSQENSRATVIAPKSPASAHSSRARCFPLAW